MSKGDEGPGITGESTITLFDQFMVFYWTVRWWLWAMVACFLIMAVAMPSDGDGGDGDTNWYNPSIIFSSLVVVWVALVLIGYWRLSREQKHVRYRVNAEHIEMSDDTGAVAVIPWTVVRRSREARAAFLFRVKPAGLRWLPKRAFAAESVAALRGIIADKMGAKAKLAKTDSP